MLKVGVHDPYLPLCMATSETIRIGSRSFHNKTSIGKSLDPIHNHTLKKRLKRGLERASMAISSKRRKWTTKWLLVDSKSKRHSIWVVVIRMLNYLIAPRTPPMTPIWTYLWASWKTVEMSTTSLTSTYLNLRLSLKVPVLMRLKSQKRTRTATKIESALTRTIIALDWLARLPVELAQTALFLIWHPTL